MATLARDAVESSLEKRGFVIEEGDHRYFRLMFEGKYTGIFTKTSRGTNYKTLGNDLVSKMSKQLKLTTKQFVDLVRCPLTAEAYLALLQDQDAL